MIAGGAAGRAIGFDLLDRLTKSLVRLTRHDEKLSQQDQDGNDEVQQEELLRAEGTVRSLVYKAIAQKHRTASVESTSEKSQNQTRVLRESVAQLERWDEDEGSAECQKQVAWDVAVERKIVRESHKQCTESQEENADQACNPWAVSVQDGSNRKSAHVGADGCDCEHQVQSDLLLVAYPYAGSEFIFGTFVSVDARIDQNWLQSGIPKDNAGSEQAVQDSNTNLNDSCTFASLESLRWRVFLGNDRFPVCARLER